MNEALLIREPVAGAGLQVEFLDASDPDQRQRWIDLWKEWPGREVTAHPSYVRLFTRLDDRAFCAAARTATGGILYPVIARPLSIEPWAGPEVPGCDLTTAYGYGGPYAWNITAPEAGQFWNRFTGWARDLGAVTSFARLSLFPDQLLPFPGELKFRGDNVVRMLDLTPDEMWMDYEGKVRKNVQRARREGLSVRFDESGERLDDFLRIYGATMDRRNALAQYYFSRDFYESLFRELPGNVMFAHVFQGDRIVSSELVLLSVDTGYFFLGGTLAEAFSLRPNDLLKHETFLRTRELGLTRFVLGGSYRPDDGLLRYKRSFAPEGVRPFNIGVHVIDPARLESLVERRRTWEATQGAAWTPAEGFFPPYRS